MIIVAGSTFLWSGRRDLILRVFDTLSIGSSLVGDGLGGECGGIMTVGVFTGLVKGCLWYGLTGFS